jgi:lipopolysaccharide/colanic/teichoic acid biosynthesis glycosyltransferase
MQQLLSRERMRSDRGDSIFSLLTFSNATRFTADKLAKLDAVLAARIRATDDAGILADDRVGILLPQTSPAGAWTLATDLIQRLPVDLRDLKADVYTYPSQDDVLAEPAEAAVELQPASGDRRRRGADRDLAIHCSSIPARPMTALFLKPLPRWKRAIDVAVALNAIFVLSPLLLAVAAAVKLTSRGPVIFRQKRDTLGGRQFMIYKFRTMTVDAEAKKDALRQFSQQDGPAFKLTNDPRITPIGKFLRTTSIDELPQLFNVLRGDMTLVGPRAMDSRESSGCEPWQRRRLDVTAGITCIWQVRGRSQVSFADWMRMDLRYIRTQSIAADLKLLVETVPAVVIGRGAC